MSSTDSTVRIHKSKIDGEFWIREFCTIRDSNIGPSCKFYERVSIKKSIIGSGVSINAGTYIEYALIGKNVQIAPNCNIVGVTHKFSSKGVSQEDVFELITICDGAWIGAGSVILSGVTIGIGSVVGAGAIVKTDIPDRHIYVGTPLQFKLYSIVDK